MCEMILIITNKKDITCDMIVSELNSRAINYYRLNTEDIGSDVNVILDFNKEKFILIDQRKNIQINLKEIKSVYYRRPELPSYTQVELTLGERQFLRNEFFYTLEGIYKILESKFWISPIFAIREAENKIYQLLIAKKLGFTIPYSIITNSPLYAESFINNQNQKCVIKPIRSGLIQDRETAKIIFTSRFDNHDMNHLVRIHSVPTYFQTEIKKKADVRVTVVGEHLFAVQIFSQDCEETVTDWRKGESLYLKHSEIHLPCSLEQKCINIVKQLRLYYGAIDLILTEENQFIFLEINPNGQWGWIQQRLGLKISEAIVDLLVERGQSN